MTEHNAPAQEQVADDTVGCSPCDPPNSCPGPIREWIESVEQRLAHKAARLDSMDSQLVDGRERMARIEDGLAVNTANLAVNTAKTGEAVELLTEVRDVVVSGKALFRLGGWIGKAIKWGGGVAMGAVGLWWAWTTFIGGGGPPKGP